MIMRARMRSPWRICARCLDVYAADDPLGDVGSHVGFFLLARLIPLLRVGLGGIADWPLRCRCWMSGAHEDQSEGLEERALFLGGDYIDVMGLAAPLMRQLRIGHNSARSLRDVKGLYTEAD